LSIGRASACGAWWALAAAFSIGVSLAAPMRADAVTPVSFDAAKTYPAELPSAIAVGQLTPAGRSFVAVADGDSEDVSVFLAEPDGSLVSDGSIPVGGHPIALAIGDLTGDGDSDIVASVAGSTPGIATLLGDGTGQFPTLEESALPGKEVPSSIALGEFTSDKRLDLVSADGREGKIALAKGEGDGKFETAKAKLYSASSESMSDIGTVKVADFNHDGKLDVASSTEGCGYENGDGEVRVFLGNGNGTLKEPPAADVLDTCATRMSVADLTGNGIPDVVTNNYEQATGGGYLASMLGRGDGTFGTLSLSEPTLDGNSLTLPDLNGDGLPDAAIGVRSPAGGPEVQVLTGTGDGTFNAPQSFPLSVSSEDYVTGITYGELTNNGKQDLLVSYDQADTDSGGVAVFLNTTGTSSPGPSQPTSTPTPNSPPLVQLCSLVGPGTPGGTGSLITKLKAAKLEVAHKSFSKQSISFEMYLDAKLEEAQFCEANLALLNVLPFSQSVQHAIIETAPTSTGQGVRSLWYEPSKGWRYNAGAPDWNRVGAGTQFNINWSGASLQIPMTPVALSNDDSKLTFDEAPLVAFHGPLLSTELVREGSPLQPITLEARLKPEIFAGVKLSLTGTVVFCFNQGASLLRALFGAGTLAEQIYEESKEELEPTLAGVVKQVSGLPSLAAQLTESIEQIAAAYAAACTQGEEDAGSGHLPVVLGGRAAEEPAPPVVIPEGADVDIEAGAGESIIVELFQAEEQSKAARFVHTSAGAEGNVSSTPPAGTIKLLPARPGRLAIKQLHAAKLPRPLEPAADSVAPWDLPAEIGRLVLGGQLSPGRWIEVAAGKLTQRAPHDVEIVLSGPGYLAQRIVRANDGVAAAEIQLPMAMRPGTWTLAIVDESGVRLSRHHRAGRLQMRLTSFTVKANATHKRGKRSPRMHRK
jgi:hypothetical protein